MKILLTGGTGLLGTEVLKLENLNAPTRSELNVLDIGTIRRAVDKYQPDTILHLAANTKPPEHTAHPGLSLENILGTLNVAQVCIENSLRLVYTSTDYLYEGKGPHTEDEPLSSSYNFGWSKLGGECAVRVVPNHLILRLSFGPRPFPWDKVYEGQWNSKLYVDQMAPLVLKATDSKLTGVLNLGCARRTLEEYARETKPDIQTIPKPTWVPEDTSLDLTKFYEL